MNLESITNLSLTSMIKVFLILLQSDHAPIERTKRNFTYENRDQNDPYK